jgi:hypothetical protein
MDSKMEIFKRISPQLKRYNVDDILEVLEEVLDDALANKEQLSDEVIIELVIDILENDPPC